jgi:hypothetical protein
VNEFLYFLFSFIFLTLYSRAKNKMFYFLIAFYLFGLCFKSFLFSLGERDSRSFLGWDIFFWKFEYAFTLYIAGVIFGIFYFEHFYNDLNKTYDSFDSSSKITDILEKENKEFFTRKIMRQISKSSVIQNILTLIAFCLIALTVILDLFYFRLFEIKSFSKLGVKEKVYLSLEIDILLISMSILFFKFVVLKKTIIKRFFEHSIWIPLSRSFNMIVLLQIPLIYFVSLNVNFSMKFSLVRVVFLCFSMILFIYSIAFLIMIFVAMPLKVLFKKVFK